jgi:hypothetical protein
VSAAGQAAGDEPVAPSAEARQTLGEDNQTFGEAPPPAVVQPVNGRPSDSLKLCTPALFTAVANVLEQVWPCVEKPVSKANVGGMQIVVWRADFADPEDVDTDTGAIVKATYSSTMSGQELLASEKDVWMDTSGAPFAPFSAGPDACWGHFFDGADVDCVRGHVAVHVSAISAAAGGLDESARDQLVAVADAAFAGGL